MLRIDVLTTVTYILRRQILLISAEPWGELLKQFVQNRST